MARNREIACVHYKAEGVCDLGKEGTFRHQCQFCKNYKKINKYNKFLSMINLLLKMDNIKI